jgi:peroxiredoxin/outer membrane lipoprotein-sorting protein
MMPLIGRALMGLALCFALESAVFAQRPKPATQPARAPSISPAAQRVLDDVRDAYSKLDSLSLAGTISMDFDAAGRTQTKRAPFTGSFQSPSKFRHEVTDDVLIVSTGDKLISYLVGKSQYYSNESPKQRSTQLPDPAKALLQEQAPSLYLALVPDAAKELAEGASTVEKGDDVALDGNRYQAIQLVQSDRDIRVLIDPSTHLVRQMQTDLTKLLKQQEVPLVNRALVTIDYTTSATAAPIDAAKFAWTAPTGATLVKPQASDGDEGQLLVGGDENSAAQKLVGEPAPAFKLQDLDGKQVTLAEQAGSVVVLDFWATWCPPCREGLPHLDELYKSKQADGLKVFAINLREDPETARRFMQNQNLSLPVLLDPQGEVAKAYLVGGIPQTVVVGKDGNVRKVMIGYADGSEQLLADAVDEALKSK